MNTFPGWNVGRAPGRGCTRRSLIYGAAATAGLLAAACSPGAQPADGGSGGTPVTIEFGTRGTPDLIPLYEAVAKAFNERQSKARVSLWLNEPDYFTKVFTAWAGGAGPDLTFTNQTNLLPWWSQGALADLTAGLNRRKVKVSDWYELAAQTWLVGGKQIGVPQGWGTNVLGINKALFKSAGVTLKPDFDVTWTHDEFVRLLKEIARVDPDGNLSRWGIDGYNQSSLLWAFGAEFLNRERTKCVINTPQAVAALQWHYDLAWSHRVMPRPAPHDRPPGGVNMWTTGQSALIANGGPHILSAWPQQLSFEFDVALIPTGPTGRRHNAYSDGYVMWSAGKHQEATLDFLTYLGTDGQSVLEQNGGRLVPAYKPVAEGIFLQGKSPFTKRKWLDALKGAGLGTPLIVPYSEVSGIQSKYYGDVWAGRLGPREAVGAIEREVNAVLAQYPPPQSTPAAR